MGFGHAGFVCHFRGCRCAEQRLGRHRGKGLWRYDSRAKKWTQFTSKDGLGDDYIYALAVDKLGRVWAGHLNHGVSVWNGEKWKNYGLLDGPLGDRVFSIAACPTDGDVWIATDCGAARYSFAKDDWDYFTRASGLPSNQIQSIAFNAKGDIILGTQCDGIATATAADGYKKWKLVAGPLQMTGEMVGDGLPSNLINAVASIDIPQLQGAEVILAATPAGMGDAVNGEWKYARGRDWKAMCKASILPPTIATRRPPRLRSPSLPRIGSRASSRMKKPKTSGSATAARAWKSAGSIYPQAPRSQPAPIPMRISSAPSASAERAAAHRRERCQGGRPRHAR